MPWRCPKCVRRTQPGLAGGLWFAHGQGNSVFPGTSMFFIIRNDLSIFAWRRVAIFGGHMHQRWKASSWCAADGKQASRHFLPKPGNHARVRCPECRVCSVSSGGQKKRTAGPDAPTPRDVWPRIGTCCQRLFTNRRGHEALVSMGMPQGRHLWSPCVRPHRK